MSEPQTRPSLMLRLRDPRDQQAWTRFVSIYEPLLMKLMRQRGLQEADARDVTQQVVMTVMRAVDTWRPDGKRRLHALRTQFALQITSAELDLSESQAISGAKDQTSANTAVNVEQKTSPLDLKIEQLKKQIELIDQLDAKSSEPDAPAGTS